jgi:hypothetical protein
VTLRVGEKVNPAWRRFLPGRSVTVKRQPVVSRDDRFFLMGSCFAEEIRHALARELGEGQVGPDYRRIVFDPALAQVDGLPDHNHMNTYNAFSVLQEVERILGLWTPDPDDWWQVGEAWQCPYRRLVFGETPEVLREVSTSIDSVLREAFSNADHFIFTFGMTEVFVNRRSGKIANQKPGYGLGGGVDETDYRRAGFAENLAVITRLVDLISAVKPKAKIFMTVSPVPLKRTFSGEDIFVANAISKSTLRAVLAEIGAVRSNVVYFPSYDAVMAKGEAAFEEDGRHVRRELVTEITQGFVTAYFGP